MRSFIPKRSNRSIFRACSQHIVRSPYVVPELEDAKIMSSTFPAFIMKQWASFGSDVAVVDGSTNEAKTYSQINKDTKAVAAALQHRGVKHHESVAVMSPNHVDFFSVFMGISLSGAYSTCLNPQYR